MRKVLIFALLLTAVFPFSGCFGERKTEIDTDSLTYFCYSTSCFVINYDQIYTCEKSGDKVRISVKYAGASPDEVTEVETDGTVMNRLGEVINKYEIPSWDGFNESNHHVLDGESFSLTVKSGEDTLISAYGANSYPENYTDATNEIEEIFQEILVQNGYEPY
ncbi:MAG: hypothetical protein Q4D44_02945 [Eubacteriales bacterium]|nr:hypothetical protein [Eubacteriales bacterium]